MIRVQAMWASSSGGESRGLLPGRTAGALFLTVVPPIFAMFIVAWGGKHKGDLSEALGAVIKDPFSEIRSWLHLEDSSENWLATARYLFGFFAFQLVLMRVLPGPTHRGNATPSGHVPEYTANGPLAYVITLGTFVVGAELGLWEGSVIFDHYGA